MVLGSSHCEARTKGWPGVVSASASTDRRRQPSIRRWQRPRNFANHAGGHSYRTSCSTSMVCSRTVLRGHERAPKGAAAANYGSPPCTRCRRVAPSGRTISVRSLTRMYAPRIYFPSLGNLGTTSRRSTAMAKSTIWTLQCSTLYGTARL